MFGCTCRTHTHTAVVPGIHPSVKKKTHSGTQWLNCRGYPLHPTVAAARTGRAVQQKIEKTRQIHAWRRRRFMCSLELCGTRWLEAQPTPARPDRSQATERGLALLNYSIHALLHINIEAMLMRLVRGQVSGARKRFHMQCGHKFPQLYFLLAKQPIVRIVTVSTGSLSNLPSKVCEPETGVEKVKRKGFNAQALKCLQSSVSKFSYCVQMCVCILRFSECSGFCLCRL